VSKVAQTRVRTSQQCSLRLGVGVAMGALVAAVVAVVAFVGSAGGAVSVFASTTVPRKTQLGQVFVVGSNGQGLLRVTSGPVSHRLSFWMPGGAGVADVAFTGYNTGKAWIESQRIGSAGHRILSAAVGQAFPHSYAVIHDSFVFSAASRKTVFESCCGQSVTTLAIVGRSGTHPRALDSWQTYYAGSFTAAWSPNGRLIAYARSSAPLSAQTDDNMEIAVIAPNGKGRRILTAGLASDKVPPAFSPDGRSIVFCASGSQPGLYTVSTTGGPVHQITQGRCDQDVLGWSPTGREIAFTGYQRLLRGQSNPYLYVIDVRTGRVRRLAGPVQHAGASTSPLAWSPDGHKVAFVGSSAVETVDSNGTGRRDLVHVRDLQILDLGWSPGSNEIAFTLGPPPANY
jgi:hypothetical protein